MPAGVPVAPGIYRAGPGIYDIHVSTGKGSDGKYGKVTRRFRGTLHAAKAQRVSMLAEVASGALRVTEPVTMAELNARYMATKGELAQDTKDQYEYLWKKLEPHVGSKLVKKVTTFDLDQAYAQIGRGVAGNTVIKVHKHAAALFARAVAWDLIPATRNPAAGATPPKETKPDIRPPTESALLKLVDLALERDRQFGTLMYVAATTGARRGELAGLRWHDIDAAAATVRFQYQVDDVGALKKLKTHRGRTVDVDDETVQRLEEHREYCEEIAADCGGQLTGECFVFSPVPGSTEPFRKDGVTQRFDKLRTRAGVNCRLHDVRHAHATMLLDRGVPPHVVAERLGDTVEVVMSYYAHSDSGQRKKAAAAGALRREPAHP